MRGRDELRTNHPARALGTVTCPPANRGLAGSTRCSTVFHGAWLVRAPVPATMRGMGRPRAFLDVLDDPAAKPIGKPTGPDALLMRMLAHMFHADDDVARSELAVFGRLVGPMD